MSSSAKAVCVPPNQVDRLWPEVSHLIKRAMERGDLGTFESVEHDVLEGKALLWLAWIWPNIAGTVVTKISRSEKSKVCTIIACGGEDVMEWLFLLEDIENYARAEGCDVVRIFGRKGWMRWLPEYRAPKVILERRL